ncbi:MAG: hypothetical protein IIA81_05240 [Thaumarchaeota archaeon]|nr:hypothetical protein [Nitrososphaerota archaeon]
MSQQTTIKALEILKNKKIGFRVLNSTEKKNLALAFARKNMVIYGKAYDIIRYKKKIDFSNEKDVEKKFDDITVYEIKSTNRKDVKKDFSGYFFDLTTAELLVAQSLKTRFKFVFVNTVTGNYNELSLNQVFAKSKAIYPKWAIRF